MGYDWNFAVVLQQMPAFFIGAANTLKLAGAVIALSVPIGLIVALIRQQRIPVLAPIALIYTDFFRSTVSLVSIFWCYFALPVLTGIKIEPFLAATLALGLQSSAFMAEIFRGGIKSIAKGQWEASKALGMSYQTSMRYVIIPQAFRRMLPVFFLSIVEITKNTSLAGIVTYHELFFTAYDVAGATYRTLETFTVVGAFYFTILYGASSLSRLLEKRLARAD